MKIQNFKDFICNIPLRHQSFTIKKSNWRGTDQEDLVNTVFSGLDTLTINRYDLMCAYQEDISEFVLKVLMWGYPTKGRGNNINTLLRKENFYKVCTLVQQCREQEISLSELRKQAAIPGLGMSTLSKLLYFCNTRIEGYPALILDSRIENVIKAGRYEELQLLNDSKFKNSLNCYLPYLKHLANISRNWDVEPDKLELFLFAFGNNLSDLVGEECYDDDLI